MKKINVLFIAHKDEIGGATKSMLDLITELKNNYNCNITVLTPRKNKVYNFCISKKIKVIKTIHDSFLITEGNTKIKKFLKKVLFPILWIKHKIFNYISVKTIEKELDIASIDIIHTNVPRDDIGGILSKKHNIYHIVHLREFSNQDYKCISLVNNYIDYLNSYTNKFIAISNAIKEYYNSLGIPQNKIERIYNGINNDIIKKYVHQNSDSTNKKLKIIFLGGITESKGQMHALIAISKLPDQIKKNIIIDFFGVAEPSYIKSINEFIINNDLKDNVNIYNYVDNINNILSKYDIGLMCSRAEAFGRVTIEYMAAGLITIASNRGANPEIINDKIEGFIYDYDNINSLRDIILHIYNNKSKLEKIKINAMKKVENEFTFKINASKIYNLYKEHKNIKGD